MGGGVVVWGVGRNHPHPLPSRERGQTPTPRPREGCPYGLEGWVLFVEGVGLLVGVGGVENCGFREVAARELESDG